VLLHEKAYPEGFQREIKVFVTYVGQGTQAAAFRLTAALRKRGISAEMEYGGKSLKSQLKRADKSGAGYTFIIGEDELSRGKVKLRRMETSSEEEVDIETAPILTF